MIRIEKFSGQHAERSVLKDVTEIVQQLLCSDMFDTELTHKSFSKMQTNLIRTLPEKSLKDWILSNFSKYTK